MPLRLVIHGGAGVVFPGSLAPEREAAAKLDLERSLLTGMHILQQGGSSLDAVCAAVRVLEDSAHFNAGKGSVLSRDGLIECDAGLMCGRTGAVGGVTCVTNIQNPIDCAQLVLTQTPHALLNGAGADALARQNGLAMQPSAYFETPLRRAQLELLLRRQHDVTIVIPEGDYSSQGTVGAVALDSKSRLATASSTGGLCGKMTGRVSDSSVCGSGFWADGRVAISGTGNGDNFLRAAACRFAADLVHEKGLSLQSACEQVVHGTLIKSTAWPAIGTQSEPIGGMIGVDVEGNMCLPFNSPGMFRGYIQPHTMQPVVAIFAE